MKRLAKFFPILLIATVLGLAGCATPPASREDTAAAPPPGSVLRAVTTPREVEDRVLALDPDRISDADVRETLSKAPTPRIILVHGGVPGVYLLMVSFGRFLVGMGYPESQIRDPRDRDWSHSPFERHTHVAGSLPWWYEREGLRPMLVGHSQGGVQVVKILRTLNGADGPSLELWDPVRDAPLPRTTYLDPITGTERPVVGFVLPYASVVGAGGFMLANPGHWDMIGRLYSIPDTVESFTGYIIDMDPIAWTTHDDAQGGPYRHNGTARVRNVMLPANYSHVFVPFTHELARDPRAREWINAYTPVEGKEPPNPPDGLGSNVLWAADVWHSVKKHWCLEAQRLIRARRTAAVAAPHPGPLPASGARETPPPPQGAKG